MSAGWSKLRRGWLIVGLLGLLFWPAGVATSPVQAAELTARAQYLRSGAAAQSCAGLYLALATRPGVTDPLVAEALQKAADTGGAALAAELARELNGKQLRRFAAAVQGALKRFAADYPQTEPGAAGIETRAAITDRLFREVLAAARGIAPERLTLAFLHGCAAFEGELAQLAAAGIITPAERAQVDLLLLDAHYQVMNRTVIGEFAKALNAFSPATAPWRPMIDWVKQVNESYAHIRLAEIEGVLADIDVLRDPSMLTVGQYNEMAIQDLLLFKIGMELFDAGSHFDPYPLAERMAELGGVMTGMAVARLVDSGIFVAWSDGLYGGPVNRFVVYDWIRPGMGLRYQPLTALPSQLTGTFGEPPPPPDASVFAGPYLAIFRLQYDLDLCKTLYWEERYQLEEQVAVAEDRPINMRERYALKRADVKRRDVVMQRLKGPSDKEKAMICALLTAPMTAW